MIKKLLQANKKYLRISLYALAVVALLIAWDKFLENPTDVVAHVVAFLQSIKNILKPFIYGFCVAYLLNPLMRKLQSLLSKFHFKEKYARLIAILLSYLLTFGAIIWLSTVFIPEFLHTANNFILTISQSLPDLQKTAESFLASFEFADDSALLPIVTSVFDSISNWFTTLIPIIQTRIPILVQGLINSTVLAASGVFSIIMSIFISFYMLSGKESFTARIKKVTFALMNPNHASNMIENLARVNQIFQGFIVGKTLDSLIIGILCFVGMLIIHSPLALLISVVVGVTNMIPYFGPFIGAIPSVLIMLMISPMKALWTLIFIIILQQFDGNYLGPKILGESTGLTPLWVILSITVGGALMGPIGMFIGVPICASLKLFFDEFVDRKYKEKYETAPEAILSAHIPREPEGVAPEQDTSLEE